MAITQLPIRMQLGGFPMFPPGMGPSIGMPRGGMGQMRRPPLRRPPPPSDEDEGGRRAPTPYSLEDLSPRHFQAPRAPNLFVGGPPVYDPSQSFPSFGGYGGNLPQVPRYGGRTGGPFGPPPPPRGYPMGGGMPGFGRGAMPFRPRPQAPQFDFDEDQMRSFFQNMMGPQDNTELTTLQDRIKELEGQISGFQKPAGVEEETTVTETETTPTPTPGVPAPTPQDSTWQLPPEIQEQIDALQVDIPNGNIPGLPGFGGLGVTASSLAPGVIPEGVVDPKGFWGRLAAQAPRTGIDTSAIEEYMNRPAEEFSLGDSAWDFDPPRVGPPGTTITPPDFPMQPLPTGQQLLPSSVSPEFLLPENQRGALSKYELPPSIVPRMPPPIEQFGGTVIPRMPSQPGPKIRPRPRVGRGPGTPLNIPRQPRVNMEQLLAGLGGLGPGGL